MIYKENDKIPSEMFKQVGISTEKSEKISRPSLTALQDSWMRIRKNKAAIVSLVILVLVIIMAIAGPWMSPHSPNAQNVEYSNLPPKVQGFEDMPFWNGKQDVAGVETDVYKENNVKEYYWFGTDSLGRDLFSRTWIGTRISLYIALIATVISLVVGVTYGMVSGYVGGRVDNFMQRIIEIISGIPNLVVVILMLLIMKPGLNAIIIAIAITGWINMARVIRAQVLMLKQQEFVMAAQAMGKPTAGILIKHLIPNLSGVIIINTMFTIPDAIFFESFLSFIGIGLQPPTASLGTLIEEGYKSLRFLPYQIIYPAVVICLIMIVFNLIADGLRDAFDPKMRD